MDFFLGGKFSSVSLNGSTLNDMIVSDWFSPLTLRKSRNDILLWIEAEAISETLEQDWNCVHA